MTETQTAEVPAGDYEVLTFTQNGKTHQISLTSKLADIVLEVVAPNPETDLVPGWIADQARFDYLAKRQNETPRTLLGWDATWKRLENYFQVTRAEATVKELKQYIELCGSYGVVVGKIDYKEVSDCAIAQ